MNPRSRGPAGNRTCRRSCLIACYCRLVRAGGVTGPARELNRGHLTGKSQMARFTAIGLMSGTSYDGVDVALDRYRWRGDRPARADRLSPLQRAGAGSCCGARSRPRPLSRAAPNDRPLLAEAEELVTDMHAEAVEAFLAANGMAPSAVAVVGFHGQTVLHRPERAAHRAARQRARAGGAARHSGGLRLPRRRRRGRRAGRADRAGVPSRAWCACSSGRTPSACSISAASPT